MNTTPLQEGLESASKEEEMLTVSQETILSNVDLLAKVVSDLRLSVEPEKDARELLRECINELE